MVHLHELHEVLQVRRFGRLSPTVEDLDRGRLGVARELLEEERLQAVDGADGDGQEDFGGVAGEDDGRRCCLLARVANYLCKSDKTNVLKRGGVHEQRSHTYE